MTKWQEDLGAMDKELIRDPSNALFSKMQNYIIDNLSSANFEDIMFLFGTKRIVSAGAGEILSKNVSSLSTNTLKAISEIDSKKFKKNSQRFFLASKISLVFSLMFKPFQDVAKKEFLKREGPSMETKTPSKKKVEFKEAVYNKLYILENEDREEQIKLAKEKPVENSKPVSLNKFKGKLSEETKIGKLLEGLYYEFI